MSNDAPFGLRNPPYYAALFDSAGNRHGEWTPANRDGSISIRIPRKGPTIVRFGYASSPDGPVEKFSDYRVVCSGDAIGRGSFTITELY